MLDLLSLDREEFISLAAELKLPAFRGKQLFHWVHGRGATSFQEMSDLPTGLRETLAQKAVITQPQTVTRRESADGETMKFLLRYDDGVDVETVLMAYARAESRDRTTVCVSTQAGCAMGCLFCATGQGGLVRNLSCGEILAQVWTGQRASRADVTNVVYMGMGEPLLNLEAVLKSIRLLNHPDSLNISMRRITVSTCGLVPEMRRLAGEKLPITLAVSLHAPNDLLRSRLMPVNKRYPIREVLAAADEYGLRTGRRVTYEYALFRGVNDGLREAEELGRLLRGRLAHVNLIPANPVSHTGLQPSEPTAVRRFAQVLTDAGIGVVVRESKGGDIDAACGQLRRRAASNHPPGSDRT